MTLTTFRRLSPPKQLHAVLRAGTLLTMRPASPPPGTVYLYHCADGADGFFVEVYQPAPGKLSTVCDSFAISSLPGSYTPAS